MRLPFRTGCAAATIAAAASLLAVAARASAVRVAEESPPAILISRQLAERRHLHAGDAVRLGSDPSGRGARPFRIAGIYEPTPDPMHFAQAPLEARLHLPDLLALTGASAHADGPDAVTSINVALIDPAGAGEFAREVSRRLPGSLARPTSAPDQRTRTFVVIERFHLAIAVVTVLGSAVFLLALMVMLVDERRATVGILRLMGFTRGRILTQVVAEGAVIAVVGAAGGILFALVTEGIFNRFFQWRYDTTLVFLRVTPSVVWRSLAIAVPLGIAASFVASWTLLRRQLLALIRR
ncbi:MAG TPA: FtsX-like permease family protein [Vicinamibacterales bacterium]|nr:FtsX-like permease family protein [Vicinamibacterales bacterium]